MDIIYILKDLYATKNLQKWINNRFKDPNKVIFDSDFCKIFRVLIMENGIKFRPSRDLNTICEIKREYDFSDMKSDDIVIDIGANIGGFAILASQYSNKVYAVEPFTIQELKENIKLNNMNITVIDSALGDGKNHLISWIDRKKKINTMTFSQLRNICGGCDFLKCDCEGFEWFITPEDLLGVRRIEMELHNFNPSPNDPLILIDYINNNYSMELKSRTGERIKEFSMKFKNNIDNCLILHAKKNLLKLQ